MRILLIHPHDLWSYQEPWTSRIANIAKMLQELGHEVRVICFTYPGNEETKPFDTSFPSYRLRRSKRMLFHNIGEIIRHARWADIIHFQKCFAHTSIPALYAHVITNKPVHYDWDDWEFQIYNYDPPSTRIGAYLRYLENAIPAFVDTISVSSHRLREVAVNLGFPEKRIVSAHVCADLKAFRPMDASAELKKKYYINKPVVMYMGQLHGAQYAELFIEAAWYILRQHDVLFMIVGSGAREQVLIQLALERKLDKHIIFTGAVPHEDIPDYLALADIAVACFEDNELTRCKSPLKIAEYLACGKAIVASQVGEIPFMLNGAGILAKPGDVLSLRDGIVEFLDDPTKRKNFEIKARLRAEEEFSWEVTARNLLEAYTLGRSLYA